MTPAGPYPGLRPFRRDEGEIFFGREDHADQLLEKLGETHFLAVLGSSGSGKSSLVHTGLLPALDSGFLARAGARWSVAELRPGNRPLRRLAETLVRDTEWGRTLGDRAADGAAPEQHLERELAKGPMALPWLLGVHPLPERNRLLIVVDQFEELFRYHRADSDTEARSFVERILAAAEHPDVYVVITMRSDYLGDCARYEGLPEAINGGLYLTPRLSAEQMADAVQLPARVFGGDVEPELVRQLLAEAGGEVDQLPLLQHALMRLWELDDGDRVLTAAEFRKLGGLRRALNDHAEEAYAELDGDQRPLAEVLFRCLTERGPDGRDVRRPVEFDEVARLAGVEGNPDALISIIDVFRRPGRCFVTPPAGVTLTPDRVVDISHEALIRQWSRLLAWTADEADQAELYQRLEASAQRWAGGRGACWVGPDLDGALQWKAERNPSAPWAARYRGDFGLAMRFLEASEEQRREQRRKEAAAQRAARRRRRAVVLACLLGASVFFYLLWDRTLARRTHERTQALLQGREAVAAARASSRGAEYGPALASLAVAERAFRRVGVLEDLTAVLLDRGKILSIQTPGEAAPVYAEARRLAEETGDLAAQAQAAEGLANLDQPNPAAPGDFPFGTALQLYQEAGDHRGAARLLERRARWRASRETLNRAGWLQVDEDLKQAAQEYRLGGDAVAAERAELDRNWGYLVNLRDGAVQNLRRTQGDVDLGRSPTSVFRYGNTLVSRKQVELYQHDPYQEDPAAPPIVFPLRSRNGTSVNGVPAPYAQYRRLESGDTIVFASEGVQFLTEPPAPPRLTAQHWGVLVSHRRYQYLAEDHLWLALAPDGLRAQAEPPAEGPSVEVRWQGGCVQARTRGDDWALVGWEKEDDYKFRGWRFDAGPWVQLGSGSLELRKAVALQRVPEPDERVSFHILPLCEVATNGCCP